MKVIYINVCSDCPVIENACHGQKPVCVHPKTQVNKPYAKDRGVKANEAPPSFCPLANAVIEFPPKGYPKVKAI